MFKPRLFNLFIAIALMTAVVLTVREAAAIADLTSQAESVSRSSPEYKDLPSRHSIHSKYISDMGVWMTYTEDGPTGVDGGLVDQLSSYRTCSH